MLRFIWHGRNPVIIPKQLMYKLQESNTGGLTRKPRGEED